MNDLFFAGRRRGQKLLKLQLDSFFFSLVTTDTLNRGFEKWVNFWESWYVFVP